MSHLAAIRAGASGQAVRLRADIVARVFVGALLLFAAMTAALLTGAGQAFDEAVRDVAQAMGAEPVSLLAADAFDDLADPPLVTVLAVATGLVLIGLRWWPALVVLVIGLGVSGWAGAELKEVFDRPRPVGSVYQADTAAFPSGHARFSFFWTWLALTIAVYAPLERRARRSLIAVGLTLTAIGGLARVYIYAHWLTDVIAGWAFSAMTFSGATLLVMALAALAGQRGETAHSTRPVAGRRPEADAASSRS